MFLTNVLFKKAKSKHVMVALKSIVTGHMVSQIRLRSDDKVEKIMFDPHIRQMVLYKETHKIRSFKNRYGCD